VEVYPSLTADIIIEPYCKLPFETASLDGIGCFAVLEHVRQPWKMAEEFARVTKPGGKLFVDWPFLQPVHGYPSHYYNATREGTRALFADAFDVLELGTGPFEGPDHTVYWILNSLADSINDEKERERFLGQTVGELCATLPGDPAWAAILQAMDDASISRLSCGNTLIAVRK
jgi:SAM-dependent methyltransferase